MLCSEIERRVIDRNAPSCLGEHLVVLRIAAAVQPQMMIEYRRAVQAVEIKVAVVGKVDHCRRVSRCGIRDLQRVVLPEPVTDL